MTRNSSLLLFTRDAMPGFRKYILPTRGRATLTLSGSDDPATLVDKILLCIENNRQGIGGRV